MSATSDCIIEHKMEEETGQDTLPVSTSSEAANEISPIKSSLTHRFFHPPKLERKHSSGDLHSRLKTRKILGVGETDNGDIHRSKISQLLGHNEHLYVKFPRGYWIWHMTMAIIFTTIGITTFLFPDRWNNFPLQEITDDSQLRAVTRYFGSTVLAMALLLWSFWGTMDKHVVRTLLAAVIVIHCLILFACSLHFWQQDDKGFINISIITECLIVASSSLYFYWAITSCNVRMRKSASHKELRETVSRLNSSDSSFNSNLQNKTE